MNCLLRGLCNCFAIWLVCVSVATAQGFKYLEVTVVDPNGKPMADVPVEIDINGMAFPMPTDAEGKVSVNVPAGSDNELELRVKHPGYVALQGSWARGTKIPDTLTINLKPARSIGGVVLNEEGGPVEGVKVEGRTYGDEQAGRGELRPYLNGEIAVTDSEGRWKADIVPDDSSEVQFRFNHPDYVNDPDFSVRAGSWTELLALRGRMVLDHGATIIGKVINSAGKPVSNARVAFGRRFAKDCKVVLTNEDGEYEVTRCGEGTFPIAVTSDGFAPDLQYVTVQQDEIRADFQLKPAQKMRFKVVDKHGQPIAGARILPQVWRGQDGPEFGAGNTNAQGIWEFEEAPRDEIQYAINKADYLGFVTKLTAGKPEYEITLLPAAKVIGTVIDKETRKPIKEFNYAHGVWWETSDDRFVLQPEQTQISEDGKFRFQMGGACEKFYLQVEAEGYKPSVSREIFPGEESVNLTFEMEKGIGPSGVVLLGDGTPVGGAEVAMATEREGVSITAGSIINNSGLRQTTTDADGKFKLPYSDGQYSLIVIHELGWAESEPTEETTSIDLKLQPWARVVGKSLRGSEPLAGDQIGMFFQDNRDRPNSNWNYRTETSGTGSFEIDRLRAGRYTIFRKLKYAETDRRSWMQLNSHMLTLNLEPGETREVNLGGSGRLFKGRLVAVEDAKPQIHWNMGAVLLSRKDADGQADGDLPSQYGSAIKPDGTFEIFDVVPGQYQLKVGIYSVAAPTDNNWNEIARLTQACEVSSEDESEVINLGTLTVSLVESQQ
jgi:hypothetical protein